MIDKAFSSQWVANCCVMLEKHYQVHDATGGQGFPEALLDVTVQNLLFQTLAVVFGSKCFFNGLLRCTAPTILRTSFFQNTII